MIALQQNIRLSSTENTTLSKLTDFSLSNVKTVDQLLSIVKQSQENITTATDAILASLLAVEVNGILKVHGFEQANPLYNLPRKKPIVKLV